MATVRTDGKWHQFKYRYEVPASVLKGDLDWTSEDEQDGYFKYQKNWYHTSQFMRIPAGSEFSAKWDGYHGTSYSTGDLIKLSKDGEEYKVGSYAT